MTTLSAGIVRLGAVAGILFAVLFFASSMFDPNPPSPDEPSAAIAAYMSDADRNLDLITTLQVAAVFCLIVFVSSLRQVLRTGSSESDWLSSIAYGGGLVAAGVMLIGASFTLANKSIGNYGDDTQVAKMLFAIQWDFAMVLAPAFGALVAASAAAILRGAPLPRWVGWFSILVAVLLLAPGFYWIGVLATMVWVIVVGVTILTGTLSGARRRVAAQPG
ncbi:MAG TPA: hypothetical protein VMM78_01440 [Thermomicrobiales bacterium]|nr:hypothetical protein [Thermomicrobiales bacterium]